MVYLKEQLLRAWYSFEHPLHISALRWLELRLSEWESTEMARRNI